MKNHDGVATLAIALLAVAATFIPLSNDLGVGAVVFAGVTAALLVVYRIAESVDRGPATMTLTAFASGGLSLVAAPEVKSEAASSSASRLVTLRTIASTGGLSLLTSKPGSSSDPTTGGRE